MPIVDVTTYTDPACPFAYSAEPIRWRLKWRYGDQLRWSLRLVGLSKDGSSYASIGFTPERAAASLRHFDRHGQPLATVSSRPIGGTWSACRAIVAVREHEGVDAAVRLLRALHVQALALARDLDAEDTITAAALAAGIDVDALTAWRREPAVQRAFEADLSAARRPSPAALALDGKLASSGQDWTGDADGPVAPRRYTCPSYVIASGDRSLEAPGFHTALTIETLVANLEPGLDQRPWAEDPLEVLRWAGEPLSTQEVASVLDLIDDRDEARRRLLAGGAVEQAAGNDGFWTLP